MDIEQCVLWKDVIDPMSSFYQIKPFATYCEYEERTSREDLARS